MRIDAVVRRQFWHDLHTTLSTSRRILRVRVAAAFQMEGCFDQCRIDVVNLSVLLEQIVIVIVGAKGCHYFVGAARRPFSSARSMALRNAARAFGSFGSAAARCCGVIWSNI